MSVRIRPECVRLLQNLSRCNFREVPQGQRDDNRQDKLYRNAVKTGGSLLAVTAPAVEQEVFIGVDQHQTQVQIWIVQIHFNFIQFGNSIVKCSCFGGLSLRGEFPCFFIDPVEPFGMYDRINDRDRIIL